MKLHDLKLYSLAGFEQVLDLAVEGGRDLHEDVHVYWFVLAEFG